MWKRGRSSAPLLCCRSGLYPREQTSAELWHPLITELSGGPRNRLTQRNICPRGPGCVCGCSAHTPSSITIWENQIPTATLCSGSRDISSSRCDSHWSTISSRGRLKSFGRPPPSNRLIRMRSSASKLKTFFFFFYAASFSERWAPIFYQLKHRCSVLWLCYCLWSSHSSEASEVWLAILFLWGC